MSYRVIGSVLFFWSFASIAQWKIGSFINHSDVRVVGAYYNKPKKTDISYLNQIFIDHQNSSNVPLHYMVSQRSDGCSVVTLSDGMKICFYSYPTYSLRRKKHRIKKVNKSMCDPAVYSHCAYVVLEGPSGDISSIAEGYNETEVFDVILAGKKGDYALVLKKSA